MVGDISCFNLEALAIIYGVFYVSVSRGTRRRGRVVRRQAGGFNQQHLHIIMRLLTYGSLVFEDVISVDEARLILDFEVLI